MQYELTELVNHDVPQLTQSLHRERQWPQAAAIHHVGSDHVVV